MREESIWISDVKASPLDELKKDITCDVLIIGGGMAGLSTALNLKDSNKKIVLIDKGICGFGVSSKTTGKLTYMQGDIYSKIEDIYDFSYALKYLKSQKEAIEIVKENIDKYNIDCDYQENISYLFEVSSDKKLNKERDFLIRAGIEYYDKKRLPINIPCNDAFYVRSTAVFHPVKYLLGIRKVLLNSSVSIYENTMALDLDVLDNYFIVKTPKGSVKALKVVICTHYPFFIVPGLMPMRLYLERSYALAAKRKNKLFNAINIDKTVYSVRYHNDYLILGGYSHGLSDKFNYFTEEEKLLNFYSNHFKSKIEYSWQVHDVMTHDSLPMIGKLNNPNLFIATGFNKWGMTNGTIAGSILGDEIIDNKNEYSDLFKPNRPFTFLKFINALTENFKIGKAFIQTKVIKPKTKNSYVINIDGVKCGVYVDEDGGKHIIKNICPHMKCSLVFNESDKTWDCPCHGSRFSIDGDVIEGPSVYNVKL